MTKTVTLRPTGEMPLLGFGTWQLRGEAAYRAIRSALETGYRHVDTATGYHNETQVGRAVRDSGIPREQIFITTKLPPDHAGRERATIEASLTALGLDYVDLWLVHWPPGGRATPRTWQEFLKIRDDNLVRAVGVSNYSTAQIDELIDATGVAPAVNQIRWGPSIYDETRADELRERGVGLEGYSPFRATDMRDPLLADIAEAHSVTPEHVVLRWHIQHGFVVIPKSATPERIKANFAIDGFKLTAKEMEHLDAMSAS